MDVTTLRRCKACGSHVEAGANFCPECGTRQIDHDHRPEPEVVIAPVVPDVPNRPVLLILMAAAVAALLLALAVGLVIGRVGTALGGLGSSGGDGDAADAMDDYAPLAEGWQEKHEHVADQGTQDDSAGLAVAANEAGAWIEVNHGALQAVADGADGDSAFLYDQLVAIFDRRADVLADIDAVATEGGTGLGAASDELDELAVLDQQAATTTCEIADVMRAEGDDPADHITPGMNVTCS
jgi:zinc-ribbon domain